MSLTSLLSLTSLCFCALQVITRIDIQPDTCSVVAEQHGVKFEQLPIRLAAWIHDLRVYIEVCGASRHLAHL